MKVAVMASGSLGLSVVQHLLRSDYRILALLTDKGSNAIIDIASQADIPCFVGNPRRGKAKGFISNHNIDVLLSINYLFLIDEDVINWPTKVAVNLHGSLLPKYRGRTPHVWAIINNETETGVTAHRISLGCDEGDIIEQVSVPINPEDTGADILAKYSKIYPQLVDSVLRRISEGDLTYKAQDESKATLFGKRTADDGKIDWGWQKERVLNWVRAQAHPYPGAFTFCGDEKIIVDEIVVDDFGYSCNIPNGQVLTSNPIRVKTPNGVVILKKVRSSSELLKPGEILK
jgi:methionyl-tRNA formyltransferase